MFATLFWIFLTLKMADLVTWSWWFVFLPVIVNSILASGVSVTVYLKKCRKKGA